MLAPEEIAHFKTTLEKRREELVKKITAGSLPHNNPAEVVDSEEEADEAEDFSNQLAVVQTFRDEVQEIDRALEEIRKGSYGICVNCGRAISKQVLEAAPESVLCEDCKRNI